MATLADSISPALDVIRAIPGVLGRRKFTITVRVNTWTVPAGGRPNGPGSTKTVTNTPLNVGTIGGVAQSPNVVQLSMRDVIASGGLYTDQMYKVGPMTPLYAANLPISPAGGVDYPTIDPPVAASRVKEVFFLLVGPGLPTGGAWFERYSEDSVSATRIFLTLKRSAVQNP